MLRRIYLRMQVEGLAGELALEQSAHQHAVKQYVDALDAKSAMQLQLQEAQQQLQGLQADHHLLQQQHQQLQGRYDTLVGQCRVVSKPAWWLHCLAKHSC